MKRTVNGDGGYVCCDGGAGRWETKDWVIAGIFLCCLPDGDDEGLKLREYSEAGWL
jgi:hypothetical protein